MTTTSSPGPGGPERGPEIPDAIPTERRKEIQSLHRQIGVQASSLVQNINGADPLGSNSVNQEQKTIVRKAVISFWEEILKSSGERKDGIKISTDDEINKFLKSRAANKSFGQGIALMQTFVNNFRPFIEGAAQFGQQPRNRVYIGDIDFDHTEAMRSWIEDYRGLRLVEYASSELMKRYPDAKEGLMLISTIFRQAVIEYTIPHLDRLVQLRTGY